MRTLTIFIILALTISTFATESKFEAQMESLLQMQAQARDAIDAGLQVLLDLKNANVQAQNDADALNKSQETTYGKNIASMLSIADQNKAQGDSSTAWRKHIESEIKNTQEYLAWITHRLAEIEEKRQAFRDQRCYASLMFVKALREHDEAIQVIKWLKEDVLGIVSGTSAVELSSGNSFQKLGAYAHLFNDEALKEFNQLTQNFEAGHDAQSVSEASQTHNTAADDNNKAGLQLNRMTAKTDERDVGNKMIKMIDDLQAHLIKSMEDLKKNEITAAWDLVKWLQSVQKEIVHLGVERETKTTYIDKLLIQIVGAKAREDEAWEIYFQSAAAYNDYVAELEGVRRVYAQEKQRREEENGVLDEVIKIYKQQVGIIDEGMRNKVNDFSVDKVFDNSDIHRSTDDIGARDGGGKLLANTAAEAEKYRI